MEAAAKARGVRHGYRTLPVIIDGESVERQWLVLDTGRHRFLYHDSGVLRVGLPTEEGDFRVGPHINGALVGMTMDKAATKRVVAAAGGMVPRGRDFARDEIEQAQRYAAELAVPVCLKPATGERGTLVFTGITGGDTLRRHFAAIGARFLRILIEESVIGATYRFLYFRPSVVAIARQDPPMVVGNGVNTLAQLLDNLNEACRHRSHPAYGPIAPDPSLWAALCDQGLGPDTILEPSRCVVIAAPVALTVEDRWVDVTDALHPSYAASVALLCTSIAGLMIGGIDVVITDPAASAQPGNHWILEINSSPDLCDHHHPWGGAPRDVAGVLVDRLLHAL